MIVDNEQQTFQTISAIDLRDICGYFKLPFGAMQQIGHRARTLGAVLTFTNRKSRSTFASVQTIARVAGLPVRTVERHLRLLTYFGWLIKEAPNGRRTATYTITDDAWKLQITNKFAPLPRWWQDPRHGVTFTYAVILGQLCQAEHVAEQQEMELEDVDVYFEHLCELSINDIVKRTGLARSVVITAIQTLEDEGYIRREFYRSERGFKPRGSQFELLSTGPNLVAV